jgi:hypothetical protein
MVTRQIELDDEASEILDSIATAYGGDANLALSEMLRAHETIESFLDEFEANHRDELAAQKEQAERDFREGRFASWEEVKRRNRL